LILGNLGEWNKKVGDEIAPGDILVSIETDKANMDFESVDEGFLAKVLVPSGTKDVRIQTVFFYFIKIKPIAILVEEKEDADKFEGFVLDASDAGSKPEPVQEAAETPKTQTMEKVEIPQKSVESDTRIKASPLAKVIAGQKGVELKDIAGSGPGGRIKKADVEKAASVAPVVAQQATKTSAMAPAATNVVSSDLYTDIPNSNVRKVIATRLLESKNTIPHFYLTVEINCDKILKLRSVLNEEGAGDYKLSVNDFVIKASAKALLDVPQVNSSWHESFIRQYE
jgi:pyruvate dehydrogenase E2 component (dihydrolipoamide acetyltransferase)